MDNEHFYVVGKSGFGKSTFLKNEILSDIERDDRAVFYIDPHGEDAIDLLDAIPSRRTRRTVYIDLSDTTHMAGFDPILEPQHVVTAFKNVWADSWGPRLEWFLYNGLAVLFENKRTIADLPKLYYSKAHRAKLLQNVANRSVREFWLREFPAYSERQQQEAMSPILNKVGQFLASKASHAITQKESLHRDLTLPHQTEPATDNPPPFDTAGASAE